LARGTQLRVQWKDYHSFILIKEILI